MLRPTSNEGTCTLKSTCGKNTHSFRSTYRLADKIQTINKVGAAAPPAVTIVVKTSSSFVIMAVNLKATLESLRLYFYTIPGITSEVNKD